MQADTEQAALDSVARIQNLDARPTNRPPARQCSLADVSAHGGRTTAQGMADHLDSPYRQKNSWPRLSGARSRRQMWRLRRVLVPRCSECFLPYPLTSKTRHANRVPGFFMPRARPRLLERRPEGPQAQHAAGLSIHTQAQDRRRTGQWSAIHGSPPLFHRQIKIHRPSRDHAARKNLHRHNVYVPNAKQFARLIRMRDHF